MDKGAVIFDAEIGRAAMFGDRIVEGCVIWSGLFDILDDKGFWRLWVWLKGWLFWIEGGWSQGIIFLDVEEVWAGIITVFGFWEPCQFISLHRFYLDDKIQGYFYIVKVTLISADADPIDEDAVLPGNSFLVQELAPQLNKWAG